MSDNKLQCVLWIVFLCLHWISHCTKETPQSFYCEWVKTNIFIDDHLDISLFTRTQICALSQFGHLFKYLLIQRHDKNELDNFQKLKYNTNFFFPPGDSILIHIIKRNCTLSDERNGTSAESHSLLFCYLRLLSHRQALVDKCVETLGFQLACTWSCMSNFHARTKHNIWTTQFHSHMDIKYL